MKLLKSKVRLEKNEKLVFDSIRKLEGSIYHVYIVIADELVVYSYCVDINTGKIFGSYEDFILSPIE